MNDAISKFAFGTSENITSNAINPQLVPGSIFNRAVVLQTLCDPSLRDASTDESLIKTLKNPNDYLRAPRNSIICRIITEGRGRVVNSDYVCYPFFSSHVMMPVKSGEQVWIFFEIPGSETCVS